MNPEVATASALQLHTYFGGASSTLFIYDFLLMFQMEVTLIRRAHWTALKIAYLLSRYVLFVDLVLKMYPLSLFTENMCHNLFIINGFLIVTGVTMSEGILTYRLWMVWNRDRRVAYFLSIIACLLWAVGLVFGMRFAALLKSGEPSRTVNVGCPEISAADRNVLVNLGSLLCYNAITLTLLVLRATTQDWPLHRSPFLKRLYRDGLVYYSSLFIISAVSVIVVALLPPSYANLLPPFVRVLHSNMSSRVILDVYRDAGVVYEEEYCDSLPGDT